MRTPHTTRQPDRPNLPRPGGLRALANAAAAAEATLVPTRAEKSVIEFLEVLRISKFFE